MAETLLSIEALTFPGDDLSVSQMHSFGWGTSGAGAAGLRTLTIVRAVDELSAGVVLLHRGAKTNTATAGPPLRRTRSAADRPIVPAPASVQLRRTTAISLIAEQGGVSDEDEGHTHK